MLVFFKAELSLLAMESTLEYGIFYTMSYDYNVKLIKSKYLTKKMYNCLKM